jgi:hypothetical protein
MAVAGRRATRRVARKQEVARGCYDGKQRRGAARADSRAAWQEQGRPARGRGRRLRGREGHVARCRTALRRQGWCTWLARAAAARGRETEEREREEDKGGPSCKLQKVQGPYCNTQITFKPELK